MEEAVTDPSTLSLTEARRLIGLRELSAVELTESCLARIERRDHETGAFARVFAEEALDTAAELDRSAPAGPLHGVCVAVKDLIAVSGHPTEGNCLAYAGHIADDAAVVGRLRRAGAVIIGKTNTHELGFGVSTPTTRNPYNASKMVGGSSGGSAAALAADMVPAALGTDTGGSVRNPSNFCGTAGLKTTPGLVPREGLLMISTSYDVIGPMARSVGDLVPLLRVIADRRPGNDFGQSRTRWSDSRPLKYASLADPESHPRPSDSRLPTIGVPCAEYYAGAALAPEVQHALSTAVDSLVGAGFEVRTVEPPSQGDHAEAGSIIVAAEAAQLHRCVLSEHPGLVSDDIRAAIGTADGLTARDLAAAHRDVSAFRARWVRVFTTVDFVLSPITPNHTLDHGTEEIDGVDLIAATTQFTFPINGAGLAAVALPGRLADDGLPVGLQLIGPPGSDWHMLALGTELERTGIVPTSSVPPSSASAGLPPPK